VLKSGGGGGGGGGKSNARYCFSRLNFSSIPGIRVICFFLFLQKSI